MSFTEEQLSKMGFKERQNAIELMELEARFEAAKPDPEPVEPAKAASETPTPEVSPEPTNTPESLQVPGPEATQELPEMSEDTLEYWKQEAENWKKRKSDGDRALGPAQQKAAKAKKELQGKEDEWKSIALTLQEKLVAIEKRLEQSPIQKPAQYDSVISPEFEETYSDIASEMKRVNGTMEERFQKVMDSRFAAIEERNRMMETEQLKAQDGAYAASHYSQLKALHQDIEDFLPGTTKGTQLFEWATKQAPYVLDVVHNPLNYTPLDVSDVLNRFKSGNNVVTKKPSLGDVMVRANSVPNIPDPEETKYLSDYEVKNIDELMRRYRKEPEKMDDLIRRYEATLTRT